MDGMEAWARSAPLWSSETIAAEVGRWLEGDGMALLEMKASQVNPLVELVLQARTTDGLREAIGNLGGAAANHGKSPWSRKGEPAGLRVRLSNAMDAAAVASSKDGSEENGIFEELLKQVDENLRAEVRSARELRIRRQFLLHIVESYKVRKSMKREETHEQHEPGVAGPKEPVPDRRAPGPGGIDPRGQRKRGRG